MTQDPRPSRRDLGRGTLALLLGGAAAGSCARPGSAARRRSIPGGYVDDGVGVGHALRDGSLRAGSRAARERRRVVVVGGGVAGLSAAWRLARAGWEDVTVLELAREIGGTSRGGTFSAPGGPRVPHPFGAHYLPLPRHEQAAVRAFLEDAGIARGVDARGRVRVADELLVRDPVERVAGPGGFFQEGLWPGQGMSARDAAELERFEEIVLEHLAVDPADGKRLFQLPLAHSSAAARGLDGTSAAAWFDVRGFTSERLRWYLEYATRDDFGARLEDSSAWALMHYFTARADLGTGRSAPYLTWPEGNARLVRHLAEVAGVEIRTGEVAVAVAPEARGASVRTVAPGDGGRTTQWDADAVVLAVPQFVAARLLPDDPVREARRSFRYGPWLVVNLHLERPPEQRGFPRAWDSVLVGSESLGYVDAGHQLDRDDRRGTVWTWYLPVTDPDERAARAAMLSAPFEAVQRAVLDDLRRAHPDIDEVVVHMDAWRWGHAMVKPTPGFLWEADARVRAAAPLGDVHFAHSDLSGIALFEEAHWQGTRAAEDVLRRAGALDEVLA
ncbi:MAG: FAD-dependent oxidoreductase [Planctomycetota bacterium]